MADPVGYNSIANMRLRLAQAEADIIQIMTGNSPGGINSLLDGGNADTVYNGANLDGGSAD